MGLPELRQSLSVLSGAKDLLLAPSLMLTVIPTKEGSAVAVHLTRLLTSPSGYPHPISRDTGACWGPRPPPVLTLSPVTCSLYPILPCSADSDSRLP
jgi:hypothetical protein